MIEFESQHTHFENSRIDFRKKKNKGQLNESVNVVTKKKKSSNVS
jgi:hypothetical protein